MSELYTLARLTSEQEKALLGAEATLGGGILIAYSRADPASWEYVPSHLGYSELTASQVECLEGLERQLGLVVLAVRPD